MMLLLAMLAQAEPGALRAPVGDAGLTAEYNGGASLAVWRDDRWGLAVDASRGAAGASLGWRHLHPDGGGLDFFAHGGLEVPLVEPGIALGLGGAARLSYRRGVFEGGLGVAVPVEVGLVGGGTGPALRLPLLVEPAIGLRLGPVRVGLTGSMGPVWVTDAISSVAIGGRVAVSTAEVPWF